MRQRIEIEWDPDSGEILLRDGSGREVSARGVMVVAHNSAARHGICIARGDPAEIARAVGEGFSRLAADDPYYVVLYRAILMEFATRTSGAARTILSPEELLSRWDEEDAEKAASGRGTTH